MGTLQLHENVTVLIDTFQSACLGLLAKLVDEHESMSPEDIEKTTYVVSMAVVNSFNLEQVEKQGAFYYQANKEKVDRFIAEATGFAKALQESGYGLRKSPPMLG